MRELRIVAVHTEEDRDLDADDDSADSATKSKPVRAARAAK
jgi:hypothetical protein